MAIAADDAGLAEAGYATESWPWLTTVPPQYLDPDMGAILRALVNPTRWLDVWRYLLFRDGVPLPPAATVAVGLTPELAGRVTPATGPFTLSDRPGPGTEPGQFKDPIGVAVGADGVIAVVDSGNARVQRFDRDGRFLGIWGEDEGGVTFTRTANGLGPTGITMAPDGITWVADTWGHRVVALDANGAIVQTIGAETVDTGDDPARVDEAGGRFFGPRDIAVSDDAIYVVDTGNERVQLFTRDGAFVDAWGGYGSGPDQLIEPVGIALGPDGNVYVADSGQRAHLDLHPRRRASRAVARLRLAGSRSGRSPARLPALPRLRRGRKSLRHRLERRPGPRFRRRGRDDQRGHGRRRRATDAAGWGRHCARRGRALQRRRPRRGAGVHPAKTGEPGRSGSGGRWGFTGTVTIVLRVSHSSIAKERSWVDARSSFSSPEF